LVTRAARTLLAGGLWPLIAVVSDNARLREALDGLPLQLALNPDPERGLSSSIRIGLDALPLSADAVLIAAADLPFLEPAQVQQLATAYRPGAIVVSRYGDHSGNPQVYDQKFFGELRQITGDRGGRLVADRHPEAVIEVQFEDRAGADIDTPEDWDRVRRLR
jgi:molybdenum cofactor cytidylyltransferase